MCAGKGSWRCPLVTARHVRDLHLQRGAGAVAAMPAGGDDMAGGVAGWCSAPCATWDLVCDFRSLVLTLCAGTAGKEALPMYPKGLRGQTHYFPEPLCWVGLSVGQQKLPLVQHCRSVPRM